MPTTGKPIAWATLTWTTLAMATDGPVAMKPGSPSGTTARRRWVRCKNQPGVSPRSSWMVTRSHCGGCFRITKCGQAQSTLPRTTRETQQPGTGRQLMLALREGSHANHRCQCHPDLPGAELCLRQSHDG